jgi:tetratricopeptide (TPR) repeat protein
MSLLATLLMSAPLLLQSGVSMQSGTVSQKAVSRDCALNVANVTGNVTVEGCPGIPAKAIEGLNRELKARRLSEDQARREAEDWRQKYEGLQASLASAGLSQALLQKASTYMEQGDLTQASKALDEALEQEDQQVAQAAATHFYRAKVAELAYDTKTRGEQLEAAYRLAPHAIIIANEYGSFLTEYGRPSEAEVVFKSLIDDATQGNAIVMQAAILINVAGSLAFQGKLSAAKEKYLEAASLWDVCSKNHVPNSLVPEAVAFAGAAQIALTQNHLAEAKEPMGRAVALAKSSLMLEGDVPPAQNDKLNLAGFLLSSANLNVAAGDLDAAFSDSEEAIKIAKEVVAPALANRGKSYVGVAKTSECLITARRMSPLLAQEYCDGAVAILDPMKDVEGGRFKSKLAQAFFMKGLVQEDMQLWSQALISLKRADALWSEVLETGQSQYKVEQAKAVFYSVAAAFNSGDRDAAVEYARRAALLTDGLPDELFDFHAQVLTESASLMDSLGNHTEAAEIIRKRDGIISVSKQ